VESTDRKEWGIGEGFGLKWQDKLIDTGFSPRQPDPVNIEIDTDPDFADQLRCSSACILAFIVPPRWQSGIC
jgi:hypothetical protein